MIARIFLFSETLSLIFAHARKKVCLSFMKNIPFSVPSIFQGFSYFVPFQAIILPDDDVLELIYDYGYDVEQIACQLKSDINLVNMKTEILRYKGYDLRQGEFRSNFLK